MEREGLGGSSVWLPLEALLAWLSAGFKSRVQKLFLESRLEEETRAELEVDIFCVVLVNSSGLGLSRPCTVGML